MQCLPIGPRPPSAAFLAVEAKVRSHRRRWRWSHLLRLVARCVPRVLVVVCPACGPALRREVRVPLPVMAEYRRSICTSGRCAIHRTRWGLHWCGTPAPLRFIRLTWLRRAAELGCGCLLALVWFIPMKHCPAERF